MLTDKIIKLANNTKNYGLKNDFTHKVSVKNKKCGDKIIVELVLKNEKIAGAGLDVYEKEPLPQDHKLRFLPNALLLPHIGYVTAENYSKFYSQMIENLESCLKNKPLRIIS